MKCRGISRGSALVLVNSPEWARNVSDVDPEQGPGAEDSRNTAEAHYEVESIWINNVDYVCWFHTGYRESIAHNMQAWLQVITLRQEGYMDCDLWQG